MICAENNSGMAKKGPLVGHKFQQTRQNEGFAGLLTIDMGGGKVPVSRWKKSGIAHAAGAHGLVCMRG